MNTLRVWGEGRATASMNTLPLAGRVREGVRPSRIYRSLSIPQRVLPGLDPGPSFLATPPRVTIGDRVFPRSLPLSPRRKSGPISGRSPASPIGVRFTLSGRDQNPVHPPFIYRSDIVHLPFIRPAKMWQRPLRSPARSPTVPRQPLIQQQFSGLIPGPCSHAIMGS
jgi:hypothetical protein